MLFQKKTERAMNWLKEQNEKELGKSSVYTADSPDTAEYPGNSTGTEDMEEAAEQPISSEKIRAGKEKKWEKESKGLDLEKHDITALMLSAFLIFLPVALVILGIFALISWVFF